MTNEDDLLTIKKSSVKEGLANFFAAIIKGYIWLNRESTTFWRKVLKEENRLRKLVENDATLILINTIAFFMIAGTFRGLIGEVMMVVTYLNLLAFLVIKMEWVQKLLKK